LYLDATTPLQNPAVRHSPAAPSAPPPNPEGANSSTGKSPEWTSPSNLENADGIAPSIGVNLVGKTYSSPRIPREGTSPILGRTFPGQERARDTPFTGDAPCTNTVHSPLQNHQTQSPHEGRGALDRDSELGHGNADMPVQEKPRADNLEYKTTHGVPGIVGRANGPKDRAPRCNGCAPGPLESGFDGGQGGAEERGDDTGGCCDPERVSSVSLLGPIYLAAHGAGRRIVGATKRGGLTPAEAWVECGRAVGGAAADRTPGVTNIWGLDSPRGTQTLGNGDGVDIPTDKSLTPKERVTKGTRAGTPRDESGAWKDRLTEDGHVGGNGREWSAAIDALLPGAAALWAPAGGPGWEVSDVRTGVRALPPRTPYGSLPLAGRMDAGARRCTLGFVLRS
jgi:hypothetical protein